MFAHLNPHSSDFGDVCALYAPFLHRLTMQSSLFESGRPVLVVVCVARKLRPCPSYSRHRDRINLGLWRSLYKGGGGSVYSAAEGPTVRHHACSLHTWGRGLKWLAIQASEIFFFGALYFGACPVAHSPASCQGQAPSALATPQPSFPRVRFPSMPSCVVQWPGVRPEGWHFQRRRKGGAVNEDGTFGGCGVIVHDGTFGGAGGGGAG